MTRPRNSWLVWGGSVLGTEKPGWLVCERTIFEFWKWICMIYPIDMNAGKWYFTSIHDTQSIFALILSLYTSPGHREEQRQVLYNLPPGKQQNTTLHLGLGRPLRLFFFMSFRIILDAAIRAMLLLFHVVIPDFPLFQTEEKNRDRYDSASLFLGLQLPQSAPGKPSRFASIFQGPTVKPTSKIRHIFFQHISKTNTWYL